MEKETLTKLGSNGTVYKSTYDKTLLEKIVRAPRRHAYTAPMYGTDVWTAFEVSFLLNNGLPAFMVIRIANPADSTYIFESKSLKLYLNSFNNTKFASKEEALAVIKRDLSEFTEADVLVWEAKGGQPFYTEEYLYDETRNLEGAEFGKDFEISDYTYSPSLLKTIKTSWTDEDADIQHYSDLLRSNCEITNQPDWGRVYINYKPNELEVVPESLLKYIVSFRNHQEFHEPTCERIYNDLYDLLKPKELTVICQYTRRGGIDISPIRSTNSDLIPTLIEVLPKLLQQ